MKRENERKENFLNAFYVTRHWIFSRSREKENFSGNSWEKNAAIAQHLLLFSILVLLLHKLPENRNICKSFSRKNFYS